MGYIESNLISGESVVYRARKHCIVLFRPAVITLLLIVVGTFVSYLISQENQIGGSLPVYIGVGTLILAAMPILIGEINRRASEFAVTNRRVIYKVGAVTTRTAEMFLNKIESVDVEQTVGGKLFGYGTIAIRGTGGSLEPFVLIAHPLEFRRQIQEQIGKTFEPAPGSR